MADLNLKQGESISIDEDVANSHLTIGVNLLNLAEKQVIPADADDTIGAVISYGEGIPNDDTPGKIYIQLGES